MTVLFSGDFLSHLGVENSVFYLKINRIKHRKHKKDVAMLGKRFISIASKCFPMYSVMVSGSPRTVSLGLSGINLFSISFLYTRCLSSPQGIGYPEHSTQKLAFA